MNAIKNIFGILLTALLISCNNEWEEHYDTKLNTVNANVWEAIQQDSSLSTFVQYMKKYSYDTLFLTDHIYTLFIPNNTAFSQYKDSAALTRAILNYTISEFYILSEDVKGLKKIQTLGEKYAFLYKNGNGFALDGVPLNFESPLYINGKYFIMNTIVYPKNNLYEFFAVNNRILKEYIDAMDTIIIDKEKSRPLGFDSLGRTIYDTVAIIGNKFEDKYFPVKHELRYNFATMVFPLVNDYNAALTEMAQSLGGNYHDYNDIPLTWQKKYLVPYLLERGVFENLLEEDDFVFNPLLSDTFKMRNILGDSVEIDYTPGNKTLCSNGYAYNYANFKVPDTLWRTTLRFEGEHLLRYAGINSWAWKDEITAISIPTQFDPIQGWSKGIASKDSFLSVTFTTNPTTYSVEFNIDNLFPRKYLMVVRTNINTGGKYTIYVNGEKVLTEFEYYTYYKKWGRWISPSSGIMYKPDAGKNFICFDCWVNNLTEYGKAKIKFEYIGPAPTTTIPRFKGLTIDYIDFIPDYKVK